MWYFVVFRPSPSVEMLIFSLNFDQFDPFSLKGSELIVCFSLKLTSIFKRSSRLRQGLKRFSIYKLNQVHLASWNQLIDFVIHGLMMSVKKYQKWLEVLTRPSFDQNPFVRSSVRSDRYRESLRRVPNTHRADLSPYILQPEWSCFRYTSKYTSSPHYRGLLDRFPELYWLILLVQCIIFLLLVDCTTLLLFMVIFKFSILLALITARRTSTVFSFILKHRHG